MDIPFEEVDVFMTVHLMLMTRITRCMFNCQSNMWAMSAVKAIHFCYYSYSGTQYKPRGEMSKMFRWRNEEGRKPY